MLFAAGHCQTRIAGDVCGLQARAKACKVFTTTHIGDDACTCRVKPFCRHWLFLPFPAWEHKGPKEPPWSQHSAFVLRVSQRPEQKTRPKFLIQIHVPVQESPSPFTRLPFLEAANLRHASFQRFSGSGKLMFRAKPPFGDAVIFTFPRYASALLTMFFRPMPFFVAAGSKPTPLSVYVSFNFCCRS